MTSKFNVRSAAAPRYKMVNLIGIICFEFYYPLVGSHSDDGTRKRCLMDFLSASMVATLMASLSRRMFHLGAETQKPISHLLRGLGGVPTVVVQRRFQCVKARPLVVTVVQPRIVSITPSRESLRGGSQRRPSLFKRVFWKRFAVHDLLMVRDSNGSYGRFQDRGS